MSLNINHFLLFRTFDSEIAKLEKESTTLALLKEDERIRADEDREAERLRMLCWQLECQSIILQRENLSLRNQFDTREFLVRLGITENRIAKLKDKFEAMKKEELEETIKAENDDVSESNEQEKDDSEKSMQNEYQQLYTKVKNVFTELLVMDSSLKHITFKINKIQQKDKSEKGLLPQEFCPPNKE